MPQCHQVELLSVTLQYHQVEHGKLNAFEARAGMNTKFSLDGLLSKYLNSLNILFCNKNAWFMLEIF